MYIRKRPFRYERLLREMEAKISDKTLRPGERLPSIRSLHKQTGLSISTVYRAFMELEGMGLVEARPKSGYYVSPVTLGDLKVPVHPKRSFPAGQVRLSSVVNSVISAVNDPSLLPLGITVTDSQLLPHKYLSRILKEIPHNALPSLLSYSLSEGHPELRRQLSLRTVGMLHGITPEDIVVTNGCTEAVALALLATTRPRDIIAVEAPTNFSFLQLLQELNLRVMEIPTDPRFGVDVDELQKIMQRAPIQACLFMPNFHNPLGATMPEERKDALVSLLNDRHIPVIEDDISSDLCFDGQRPVPLKAFDRQDLVLTCSSFSKTLAPGLRIGWIIPGKRYAEKIQNLKAGINVSTSALDQYLIAQFLRLPAFERHLRTLRGVLKKQMVRTALALQEYFPPDTRTALPEGGSLLWVQLPPGVDGLEVHRRALDRHIAIIPGTVCANSEQFADYIQVGFGSPFTPAIEKGLATVGEIVHTCVASRPAIS